MIRKIEELSINAFPSNETLYYDGWILRLSGGAAKRINSVYSLYDSKLDVEDKIRKCENIYFQKNQNSVFKLTCNSTPTNLDSLLRDKGYKEVGRTSIQTLDLNTFEYNESNEIKIYNEFSDEWFNDFCDASNKSEADRLSYKKVWKSIIPKSCFISYEVNGETVAFSRGVMEEGFVGVYGIYVKSKHRRKGYGKLITCELLKYAKSKGFMSSYLQVEVNNLNALNLYKKLGYSETYQYWYLLKKHE